MDKSKLTLLKRPQDLKAANNFWRCCPLSKEYLPETTCPEGSPTIQKGKVQAEPRCAWWVNSSDHNYCFWRYVKDKSDSDGMMKELVQSELAALFGWSNTKTHFMLKQAMVELADALKTYGAIDLLQDLDSNEEDHSVNIDNFLEPGLDDPTE